MKGWLFPVHFERAPVLIIGVMLLLLGNFILAKPTVVLPAFGTFVVFSVLAFLLG